MKINKSKTIIILGAGPYYINLIKSIKELNYHVIALDKNPENLNLDLSTV